MLTFLFPPNYNRLITEHMPVLYLLNYYNTCPPPCQYFFESFFANFNTTGYVLLFSLVFSCFLSFSRKLFLIFENKNPPFWALLRFALSRWTNIYLFSGFNGFMPFSVTSASQCLSNLPFGSDGRIWLV